MSQTSNYRPTPLDLLIRADGRSRIEDLRERNLLRTELSHWAAADLFQTLLPMAMVDVLRLRDFPAFREVWIEMLGPDMAAWLPALYLAAASSPAVLPEARLPLVESALPWMNA